MNKHNTKTANTEDMYSDLIEIINNFSHEIRNKGTKRNRQKNPELNKRLHGTRLNTKN